MNILIVHYNTPDITECLVKSINKHCQNANIFIFDNSDKLPFTNKNLSNVTLLDNTKQQIIKFNTHQGASIRHMLSVEKCFSLINDDFILLDSDTIVKKDLSSLVDETCIFKSSIINESRGRYKKATRITPWCCYINVLLCKENDIHFYYSNYIYTQDEGNFDTGAAFYKFAKEYKHEIINVNEYINHLNCGSWFDKAKNMGYKFKIEKNEFLSLNKPFYTEELNDSEGVNIIDNITLIS